MRRKDSEGGSPGATGSPTSQMNNGRTGNPLTQIGVQRDTSTCTFYTCMHSYNHHEDQFNVPVTPECSFRALAFELGVPQNRKNTPPRGVKESIGGRGNGIELPLLSVLPHAFHLPFFCILYNARISTIAHLEFTNK